MTEGLLPWELPLGAAPADGGVTRFRVWAPRASAVGVEVGGVATPLAHEGLGVFAGDAEAVAGDDYRFVLDDGRRFPDPCSRCQPEGVRGPSRVVDPAAFAWTADGWTGLRRDALVIYELHVGTFTPEGTFAAAAGRLADLRDLGVTAIELMPVADVPGRAQLGLRRALRLGAATPPTAAPRGSRRWSTPRTATGSG